MTFAWIQNLLSLGETPTQPSSSSFLGGMETGSTTLLQYHQQVKCKEHWDYHGMAVPINGCNVCWEMYYQKCKRDRNGD